MSWITITEAHLLEYLSGQELESFRRATTRPGEADPVQGVIDRVTSLIRGHVLQCPRYTLGGDGTIPDALLDAACAIAIVRLMSRAGGGVLDQSGERKKAADAAMKLLRDVSEGKGPTIALPTAAEGTGSEVAPPGIIPMQYSPPTDTYGNEDQRQFDRMSQEGS